LDDIFVKACTKSEADIPDILACSLFQRAQLRIWYRYVLYRLEKAKQKPDSRRALSQQFERSFQAVRRDSPALSLKVWLNVAKGQHRRVLQEARDAELHCLPLCGLPLLICLLGGKESEHGAHRPH
jgi:hypothetical protein